jgi:hypothetical protein
MSIIIFFGFKSLLLEKPRIAFCRRARNAPLFIQSLFNVRFLLFHLIFFHEWLCLNCCIVLIGQDMTSQSNAASEPESSATSSVPETISVSGKRRPKGDYEEHVVGHLKELRNRIIIAGAALFIGAVVAYPFSGRLLAYLWSRFIPENVIMSVYSPMEYVIV